MAAKHFLAAASFFLCAELAVAQSTAVAPPARQDDVARSIEAIAKIRFAGSPSLSPDGKRLAYVSSASGIPQVWVMDLASSQARQLTDLPDPVQSVYWSPEGDWLAYDVAPGGGLNVQIYVMKADGSGVKRLTAGGQENNALSGWTDDGRYIRAASAARSRRCSIQS